MLSLTHHFQQLPKSLLQTLLPAISTFCWYYWLVSCICRNIQLGEQGCQEKRWLHQSSGQLSFMVRGVAESLAHPSGGDALPLRGHCAWPGDLCSLCFHFLSFSLSSSFLGYNLHLSQELRAGPRPRWLLQPAAL